MRILDWKEFQHYKDRNPPWIKLHSETLTSEYWVSLDDASRVLAVACMLVAARFSTDGSLPDDPEFIKRFAYLNSTPDFKPLIKCGFIVDDTGCLQDACATLSSACSETETEERQSRGEKRVANARFAPPTVQEVSDYVSEKDLRSTVDPEHFIDFYTSKNWMVGKNKMKDWKAAVRNWSRKSLENPRRSTQTSYRNSDIWDSFGPEYQAEIDAHNAAVARKCGIGGEE